MTVKNLGRVTGLSAYEIWLNQGNTGTEEEFLNSLKGKDGVNGIDGTNGVNGVDGKDGNAGKSAYEYATEKGYTGTEEEFAEKLAQDSSCEGQEYNPYKNLKGKYVSFLGDSITTFSEWIPNGYATWYPNSNAGINAVENTWWRQFLNTTGMKLCVNASWSGSTVTGDSTSETSSACGCSNKRIEDLTSDGIRPSEAPAGTTPDIIIVFIGINDFGPGNVPVGNWDGKTIPEEGTITDFDKAYALMVKKILSKYTNAELFLCTLPETPSVSGYDDTSSFPTDQNGSTTLYEYNQKIRMIADIFGVNLIDLHSCGYNYFNANKFLVDNLHPNSIGAKLIAKKAVAEILSKSSLGYLLGFLEEDELLTKEIIGTYAEDDTNLTLQGKWIKYEDGTLQDLDNWRTTTLITIPDNAVAIGVDAVSSFYGTAVGNKNNTTPIAFYDESEKFISAYDVSEIPNTNGASFPFAIEKFDIPANAHSVRLCWDAVVGPEAITPYWWIK